MRDFKNNPIIKFGMFLRDKIENIRLSFILHTSFISLLLFQIIITVSFLRYGFEQNSPDSSDIEKSLSSIRNALQSREMSVVMNDPLSVEDNRPLAITQVSDALVLNKPVKSEFDSYRTCRRRYEGSSGNALEVCIATLPRDPARYGEDFKNPGKFLYTIIHLEGEHLASHLAGDQRIEDYDRIVLEFALGGNRDRLAIVNEDSAVGLQATVFNLDQNGPRMDPSRVSQCQLRQPSQRLQSHYYLCNIAHSDVRLLKDLAWPPSEDLRRKIEVRAAVYREGSLHIASYRDLNGEIENLSGDLQDSIKDRVGPLLRNGVEACLQSPTGRVIWQSRPRVCQEAGGEVVPKPFLSANCSFSCLASQLLFDSSAKRSESGYLSGTSGPRIVLLHDRQKEGEDWIQKEISQGAIILVIILIFATILVYYIVVRKVLVPIQEISKDVESKIIDTNDPKILISASSRNEIGILVRAFNALLVKNKDLIDAELVNIRVIGHDIRSPLQSLLAMPQSKEAYQQLKRIQNAIERFDASRNPIDAFAGTKLAAGREDVALFFRELAKNIKRYGTYENVRYDGPRVGVWINADISLLEDVVSHIIDNANRHRITGTTIMITLSDEGDEIVIAIANEGEHIPVHLLEDIFEYGVTTQAQDVRNLGQGLFAARSFVKAMGGTIRAYNHKEGVTFRMVFPKVSGDD